MPAFRKHGSFMLTNQRRTIFYVTCKPLSVQWPLPPSIPTCFHRRLHMKPVTTKDIKASSSGIESEATRYFLSYGTLLCQVGTSIVLIEETFLSLVSGSHWAWPRTHHISWVPWLLGPQQMSFCCWLKEGYWAWNFPGMARIVIWKEVLLLSHSNPC